MVDLFYGLAMKYSYLGALNLIVRLHELTGRFVGYGILNIIWSGEKTDSLARLCM